MSTTLAPSRALAAKPALYLTSSDPKGHSFTLKPVAYESSTGQWIQHPDLKMFVEKDLFVAVSPKAMVDPTGSSDISLIRNDSILIDNGRYSLRFEDFDTQFDLADVLGEAEAERTEIAVAAHLTVTDQQTGFTESLRPIYAIRMDRSVNVIPARGEKLSVLFTSMDVNSGAINLALEGVAGPDYVIVQAYEKPVISLVWIGLIILSTGFGFSVVRRARELRFRRKRSRPPQ